MTPITTSIAALACILVGVTLGSLLRRTLPTHHLSSDTKDVVRLGTGLIATISALVLGLLIASASSAYEAKDTEVKKLTANFILLDTLLAHYGSEATDARNLIRRGLVSVVDQIWRENKVDSSLAFKESSASVTFVETLIALSPHNDAQRVLKDRAIETVTDLAQTRLLLFAQRGTSFSAPFLVILIFWLTIIFMSFSLFARPNVVGIASLVVFAVSAAAALFLILELIDPFAGLMQISKEPLLAALSPMSP